LVLTTNLQPLFTLKHKKALNKECLKNKKYRRKAGQCALAYTLSNLLERAGVRFTDSTLMA
jgi:hypothetical protein